MKTMKTMKTCRLSLIGIMAIALTTSCEDETPKHNAYVPITVEYLIDEDDTPEDEPAGPAEDYPTNVYGGACGYDQPYVTPPVYDEYTPSREPIRKPCWACSRNPGQCGGCDGTGKVRFSYVNSTGEWIMRDCTACSGIGRCHACGGDGWVDEGQDF